MIPLGLDTCRSWLKGVWDLLHWGIIYPFFLFIYLDLVFGIWWPFDSFLFSSESDDIVNIVMWSIEQANLIGKEIIV